MDVLHSMGNNDGGYPTTEVPVVGHHPAALPEIGQSLPADPMMPPTPSTDGSSPWVPETDKPYMCSDCGKGYMHIFTLNRHRRTVCGKIRNTTGPWKCPRCSRSYVTEGNLVRHVRFECGVRRKFYCIFCERKFTQRCSLTRHIGNFHNKTFDKDVAGSEYFGTTEGSHFEGKSSDDSRI